MSVITVWGSKTVSFSFNSILFDGKLNLVGAFEMLKCPIVFKSAGKNNIKFKGKWEFLRIILEQLMTL